MGFLSRDDYWRPLADLDHHQIPTLQHEIAVEHAILLTAKVWVGFLLLAMVVIWFVLVRQVCLDFIEKRRANSEFDRNSEENGKAGG